MRGEAESWKIWFQKERRKTSKRDFRVTEWGRFVSELKKAGCLFFFLLVFVSERCQEVLEKTKKKINK